MKTSATNRKLRLLLTGTQNATLIPRPEFQRRLVWANKHKLAFLKTVMEGYPFPEIYIAAGDVNSETGEGTEMLVDGQQRITTLHQYFKGSPDLILGKEIAPYKDLSEEQKIAFLEYEVVIRDLGTLRLPEILEVFQRINSTSYSLNAMEIHNSRFDGEFKDAGDELATHPFFEINRFFTAQEIRRMSDTKFCLTMIATWISGYFNRDDAIENYLSNYNETFDQRDEIIKQFNCISEFINFCEFEPKSRAWKKADLFTLLVEIHRALFKRKIDINKLMVCARIKEFLKDVDSDKESQGLSLSKIYYKAALQASNDRGNRIRRGEIIQFVIDPDYKPQLDFEQLTSETAKISTPDFWNSY